MVVSENLHPSKTIQTRSEERHICMYAITINEVSGHELKESFLVFMRRFGGRKGKEEMMSLYDELKK